MMKKYILLFIFFITFTFIFLLKPFTINASGNRIFKIGVTSGIALDFNTNLNLFSFFSSKNSIEDLPIYFNAALELEFRFNNIISIIVDGAYHRKGYKFLADYQNSENNVYSLIKGHYASVNSKFRQTYFKFLFVDFGVGFNMKIKEQQEFIGSNLNEYIINSNKQAIENDLKEANAKDFLKKFYPSIITAIGFRIIFSSVEVSLKVESDFPLLTLQNDNLRKIYPFNVDVIFGIGYYII